MGIYLLASSAGAARWRDAPQDLHPGIREVADDIWKEYQAARQVLDPVFQVDGIYWNDGVQVRKVWPEPAEEE